MSVSDDGFEQLPPSGRYIDTVRGRAYAEREHVGMRLWKAVHPHLEYRARPNEPIRWDGEIFRDEKNVAISEYKGRHDVTLSKLFGEWKGEWMLTASKVEACIEEARRRRVPFYGFMYLEDEDVLLYEMFWHPKRSEILVRYDKRPVWCLQPITGRKEETLNIFLSMKNAEVLRGNDHNG